MAYNCGCGFSGQSLRDQTCGVLNFGIAKCEENERVGNATLRVSNHAFLRDQNSEFCTRNKTKHIIYLLYPSYSKYYILLETFCSISSGFRTTFLQEPSPELL